MSLLTVILKWFVDSDIASATIREGKLIREEDIECRPEKVPVQYWTKISIYAWCITTLVMMRGWWWKMLLRERQKWMFGCAACASMICMMEESP